MTGHTIKLAVGICFKEGGGICDITSKNATINLMKISDKTNVSVLFIYLHMMKIV